MDFTLETGAKLHITVAPFEDAFRLQKALIASTKGVPLEKDLMQMELATLKDIVVNAITSTEVVDAMFKCMERATYDNKRVNRDLFDEPNTGERNREDFYEICWRIAEVNCGPFFKRIFSKLKVSGLTPPVAQK